MRNARLGWAAVWLAACASGEEVDAAGDPAARPDPGVNTYVPEGYRAEAPTRLVFLGDSITAGYVVERERDAYSRLLESNNSRSWPDYDEVDVESSFPTVEQVIDVSVGGATTETMINNQLSALESRLGGFPVQGETLVVFTIGGNDAQGALLPTADAEAIMAATLANMEEIVDWFLDEDRFTDGVRVYATNIYEPTDGTGQSAACFFGFDFSSKLPLLEQFNDDLRGLGVERGVSIVDLRGHFLGHGFHYDNDLSAHYDAADPTLWLADDCIHPNERGHHELRRLFHAAMVAEPLALEVGGE